MLFQSVSNLRMTLWLDSQVEEAETSTQSEPQQPSPPRSNGGTDVMMQLKAWKERGARIEQLLAKKNAKMQEMEETVSCLQFLESLDNWRLTGC